MLIRHLRQLKTVVFLHRCLICVVLLALIFACRVTILGDFSAIGHLSKPNFIWFAVGSFRLQKLFEVGILPFFGLATDLATFSKN